MTEKQYPVSKPEKEWQAQLTPEQYEVTRKKATERPFTGKYYHHHESGLYHCVCCGQPLFDSNHKYESGSGWPSFWQAIRRENIHEARDVGHGTVRTEILCKHCGAHLGHVFEDGPEPTGLRYCVNSASLTFTLKP